MDTVSALLSVDSGPPTTAAPPQGDKLVVRRGSPWGLLSHAPGGPNTGAGSVFVRYPLTTFVRYPLTTGAETRIDYAETERVTLEH